MKKDEKNIIIDNVFTEAEINDLYSLIESTSMENTIVQGVLCHRAYLVGLPDSIMNKINSIVKENFDIPMEPINVCFARYSIDMYEDGSASFPPRLFPHVDDAFHEPRLTLDFQIKSNISWPIIVEEREYILNDNQALTFSGTHQVHWRPHKKFAKGDFVDLIFAHYRAKDATFNSLDNNEQYDKEVKDLSKYYLDIWNEEEIQFNEKGSL